MQHMPGSPNHSQGHPQALPTFAGQCSDKSTAVWGNACPGQMTQQRVRRCKPRVVKSGLMQPQPWLGPQGQLCARFVHSMFL